MAGKKERERAFVENGSMLLEKMIGTCNGKSTPIRNFSYQEIKRATNNFDASLVISPDMWGWYKGSLDGRNVLIKKWGADFVNDVTISAMMSPHKNVLRLIGCCLETQPPSTVFEFPANGILFDRIHHVVSNRSRTDQRQYEAEPMVWSSRLRIAREIAHAISYLHTAFSRPIIHRDIKLHSVFLDQDDVAKLSNFELSISIPQGETHVEDAVCGTVGHICPEYLYTGRATEKADVFGFGLLLFELLTGRTKDLTRLANDEGLLLRAFIKKKRDQGDCINEIMDPTILQREGGASISIEHQLQAVIDLALTCTEDESAIRPTMVDVTKQLRRIERSVP